MKNSPFWGDGGGGLTTPNNVDISQRTAEGAGDGQGRAQGAIRTLRKFHPELWDDPVRGKRLEDLLRDSQSAGDTTPTEDSVLRQETPEVNDWSYRRAQKIVASWAKQNIYNTEYKDPDKREEYVRGLAAKLRESFDANGRLSQRLPMPPKSAHSGETRESPALSRQADNEFWGDIENLRKAVPKKL